MSVKKLFNEIKEGLINYHSLRERVLYPHYSRRIAMNDNSGDK
ncbi:hypothetical protein MASR2M70_20440 [Bacillota bacterium]